MAVETRTYQDLKEMGVGDSWALEISGPEIARAVTTASDIISRPGRYIQLTDDFEAVHSQVIETSKGRINLESSPFESDLTGGDAKYIVVKNEDGEIDGFSAIRRFNIGEERLAGHLFRQYRRIYGRGRAAFIFDRLPPITHDVRGVVVCLSDVFIEKRARGFGIDRITPTTLICHAYAVAMLEWRPDWVYGFIKNRDHGRGLGAKYLMTGLYPSAITWLVDTPNRRDDDWLMTFDRSQLGYVLRHFSRSAPNG